MNVSETTRLLTGMTLFASLAACGSGSKPADQSTKTTISETAPAVQPPSVPVSESAAVPAAVSFASLTGDPVHGEKVFTQCKTCHVAEKAVNRIGPSLWGVVGRPAGSVAGYAYSQANKNSGLTWTDQQVFTYLEAPQKVVPGTKMTFRGLKNPQDRADVIAYLKTRA